MAERRFHLGIDYGTSTSKLVFRDYGGPGGEKAFVVVEGETFRIPSTVAVVSDRLVLGSPALSLAEDSRAILYDSVKMRVAEEASKDGKKFHYGVKPDFPNGFRARELAILTVWWLISSGHRAIQHRLAHSGGGDPVIGMTLGIPMSFVSDRLIRAEFLIIAKTAWRLFRREGSMPEDLTLTDSRRLIDKSVDEQVSGMTNEEIRDWVRSESEAAMWWAFQSPSVKDGPFAQIDVGAGTTNASLFRICGKFENGKWVKTNMGFFHSCSEPSGMDAVDDLIYKSLPDNAQRPSTIRGSEDQYINTYSLQSKVSRFVKESIWRSYEKSWQGTYRKIGTIVAECNAWRDHKVLLVGGGNLINAVRSRIPFHPSDSGKPQLHVQQLEMPGDLFLAKVEPKPSLLERAVRTILRSGNGQFTLKPTSTDLPFLSVAYGLSNIGIAVPEIVRPEEMPVMVAPSQRRERLTQDDIYAK